MKFFKNTNGEVYAFAADGSQNEFIGDDLIEINEFEAKELRSPPKKTDKQVLQDKIIEIESTITLRRIREAILGVDDGWLGDVNERTELLRSELAAL